MPLAPSHSHQLGDTEPSGVRLCLENSHPCPAVHSQYNKAKDGPFAEDERRAGGKKVISIFLPSRTRVLFTFSHTAVMAQLLIKVVRSFVFKENYQLL